MEILYAQIRDNDYSLKGKYVNSSDYYHRTAIFLMLILKIAL